MEIFHTQKSCVLFFLVVLSFSICPGHSLPPAGGTETTANQQQAHAGVPQSGGNNTPLFVSPPINKIPFAKPVGNGNQGQQYQQQQQPNYPQQGIDQPLSGFNQQPYSTINQPYSGLNQPFSSFNQPSGATNQQGSAENAAAFVNRVSKGKTCIHGVVLVFLLTLMVSFGLLV